ncbi:hypothetical protein GCM10022247_31320 [Allokutzneria multivorans]|uniref:Uncharacterized protein n=1 Tax=Allokutzneria multivorans TaxID=1142134 RepID=A0ABP7S657_9PSEU
MLGVRACIESPSEPPIKRWKEVKAMAKNSRQTGSKAASAAGKTLSNPKASGAAKAAAASALSQTPKQAKKK